jgi:hypothetical protein
MAEEKKRGRKPLTSEQKEINKLSKVSQPNNELFEEITTCITEVVTLLKSVHKLKPTEVSKIKVQLQNGINSIDKVITSNKEKAQKELEIKELELEKTKAEIKELKEQLK